MFERYGTKFKCPRCKWIGCRDDMDDIGIINFGSWEWHGFKCPICGKEHIDEDENEIACEI